MLWLISASHFPHNSYRLFYLVTEVITEKQINHKCSRAIKTQKRTKQQMKHSVSIYGSGFFLITSVSDKRETQFSQILCFHGFNPYKSPPFYNYTTLISANSALPLKSF